MRVLMTERCHISILTSLYHRETLDERVVVVVGRNQSKMCLLMGYRGELYGSQKRVSYAVVRSPVIPNCWEYHSATYHD